MEKEIKIKYELADDDRKLLQEVRKGFEIFANAVGLNLATAADAVESSPATVKRNLGEFYQKDGSNRPIVTIKQLVGMKRRKK